MSAEDRLAICSDSGPKGALWGEPSSHPEGFIPILGLTTATWAWYFLRWNLRVPTHACQDIHLGPGAALKACGSWASEGNSRSELQETCWKALGKEPLGKTGRDSEQIAGVYGPV